MDEPRCSAISRQRDEPLRATASMVNSWVLVEQPGAWGSDALAESRLPPGVATELEAHTRWHGVRVVLLRRPDRPTRAELERHCFVAYTGRDSPWVEHRVVSDLDALLSLDFASVAQGRRPGFGDAWSAPLYLVCTNGRHDPCCAQQGRPVVRALMDRRDEGVWECSHIGGDRFAANLVCLPDGLYFGRLGPDEALRVVQGYERGVIDLAHYRGRSGDLFTVQAAEYFLRDAESLVGIDDVVPERQRTVSPGVVEVRFAGPGGRRFEVRIGVRPAPEARPLTCTAVGEGHPVDYALLDLRSG